MLSSTKVNYLYTPGSGPVIFDVRDTGQQRALRPAGTGPRRQQQLLGQLRRPHTRRSQRAIRFDLPDGEWIARCPRDATPSIAIADLDQNAENHARPWRRTARNGIYDPDPVISTDGQEPLERSVITGHHWWTPSELREATEQILPLGLPGLLASLLREGIPDQPLRLPWRA
jgi:hypothetical protein